ncbi:hypothetical protein LMIY3S_00048 [Labrys miyagiensis]
MAKLKLGPIIEDKAVKLTFELPAPVFRDLELYAEVLAKENGQASGVEPVRLIAPMLERFMATDRAFAKSRQRSPT